VKIAILIVGEYRTFAQCRRTMLFLDEPGIDIYVSTWDKTNTVNPVVMPRPQPEPNYIPVTIEQIRKDIGIDNVTCVTHKQPEFSIFPNIIESWTKGFDVLKQSGKSYDYVLMMRPDLFFQDDSHFLTNTFKNYTNTVGVLSPPDNKLILDDTVYFSTFSNIEKIMSNIKSRYKVLLELRGAFQWHHFLHEFITQDLGLSTLPLPIGNDNKAAENVIGRFPIDENTTFKSAFDQFWVWFRENN